MIFLPSRQLRQPRQRVFPNPAFPLQCLVNGADPRFELVSRTRGFEGTHPGGTQENAFRVVGAAWSTPGISYLAIKCLPPHGFFLRIKLVGENPGNTFRPVFGNSSGGGTYSGYPRYFFSGTNILSVDRGSSSGSNSWSVGTLSVGKWYNIYAGFETLSIEEEPLVVIDGDRVTPTKSGTATGNMYITTSSVLCGYNGSSSARNFLFSIGAILRRASLRDGVVLTRDPWQLFGPSAYPVYASAAASLPTLSSPTAINITSGGFQPRVTATY